MKTIFFAVLFLSTAALAQTCQTNTATLIDEQKSITGQNGCNRTGSYIDVITITDTYEDKTVTTANAANPGVTVLDVNSSVTGVGSCTYDQSTNVQGICPPIMTMTVTTATSTSDFNRFINLAIDREIANLSTGACGNAPSGQRQDLRQVAGQACAAPTPTPPPPSPPSPPPDPCLNATVPSGSGSGNDYNSPDCSPIIIDTEGEGFHLTSAQAGVMFDITGTGYPVQIAWTDGRSHNAFLSIPGPDGLVHNGKELFGNFTPQPPSPHPNGFLALAVYDQPQNGGNGDGIIDARDAIFNSLRLWIDDNHDGICQPEELFTLPELGVFSLSLDYSLSRREDRYGNVFRYRAKVDPLTPQGTSRDGPWAYDIFLTTQ